MKKRVEVLIPFRIGKKLYKEGQKAEIPEDKAKKLLVINCNMFIVLGDVEEKEKQ